MKAEHLMEAWIEMQNSELYKAGCPIQLAVLCSLMRCFLRCSAFIRLKGWLDLRGRRSGGSAELMQPVVAGAADAAVCL